MAVMRRAFVVAIWFFAAFTFWSFVGAWWAPDACLDVTHGSFDYRNWECSDVQQPSLDALPGIYEVPGFWSMLLTLLLAIGGTVLERRTRGGNDRRDENQGSRDV